MQQFRKGDVVMVPGVVKNDQSKEDSVYVSVSYDNMFFKPEELQLVRPFFKPGERALRPGGIDGKDLEQVEILALHDEMVWIRDEQGSFASVKAIHLKRPLVELEPPETNSMPVPPPSDGASA